MDETVGLLVENPVRETEATSLDSDFERLLVDAGNLAFRVAYAVLRHRQDAEDVAQEALARAHRDFTRLRDRGRFRSWLVRISWRQALQHRRARVRRERREQALLERCPPSAEDLAAASEFRTRLWRAIDDLPEKQRLVVVLAGIEGHTVADVGALLGIREGTVKSRLFLARKRLAEALR